MNIKPLIGRVLLKKIKTEKVGGFYVAESSKDGSSKGEVISVGAFEKDKVFDIKTGDIALFPNWSGVIVSNSSEGEYVIVKAEEILGIEE